MYKTYRLFVVIRPPASIAARRHDGIGDTDLCGGLWGERTTDGRDAPATSSPIAVGRSSAPRRPVGAAGTVGTRANHRRRGRRLSDPGRWLAPGRRGAHPYRR